MQKIYSKIITLILISLASFNAKGLTASFTLNHTTGCSPLTVSFHNTSTGDTAGFIWNLGNGSPLVHQTDVSATYLTTGTYTITLTVYSHTADTLRVSHTVTVYPTPAVSFIVPDTSVCNGTPITFTSTTTTGSYTITSYNWTFGDGTTSTSSHPTHTYPSPGFYNVTLYATNNVGCTGNTTIDSFIHVYANPVPTLTATPSQNFCHMPAVATFVDTSSYGTAPYIHKWYFGDGDSSALHNPVHTYNHHGRYTVQLKVTDINGCSGSITKSRYIFVDSNILHFRAPDSACLNTEVYFFDSSRRDSSYYLAPPLNYFIYGNFYSGPDFSGIYGSSYDGSVYGTYSAPGLKTIILIKTNAYGCTDTAFGSIYIHPMPIDFAITPQYPCPEPSAVITATATMPIGSTAAWNWGDHTSSTGNPATHTYTTLDTFANGLPTYKIKDITLTATDVHGCIAALTKSDTIYNMLFKMHADVTSGCDSLTCNFSTTYQTTVPFLTAFGSYPRPVAHYLWDFGDGNFSTLATPAHTFHGGGNYLVRCLITTIDSCTARDSLTIRVGTPDSVYFTATFDTSFIPGHMCFGTQVHFHAYDVADSSYGQVIKYAWDFEETRDTVNLATTTHKFSVPGTYDVFVTALSNGCPGDTSRHITFIVDPPMVGLTNTYSCDSPYIVHFADASIEPTTYWWRFGDGTESFDPNPVHTYPAISTLTSYDLKLVVYNATSHCRDSATVPISILNTAAVFSMADTTLCKDDLAYCTAPALDSGYTSSNWYINNSLYAVRGMDRDTFTHYFHTTGYDTIKLVTTDIHSCPDTFSIPFVVSKPVAHLTVSPTTGCRPLTALYTDSSTFTPGTTLGYFNRYWSDPYGIGGAGGITTSDTVTIIQPFNNIVREYVFDNQGCWDFSSVTANVIYNEPWFVPPTKACAGAPVTFAPLTTTGSSYWDFGDGTHSTMSNPSHTYADTGLYTVFHSITDPTYGCIDTVSRTIRIVRPHAAFTMPDTFFLCPPVGGVTMTSTSTSYDTLKWTSGNGSFPLNNLHPTFVYAPGVYTVQLVAVDRYGCSDTARKHLTLFGYSGDFAYPDSGCGPYTVNFHISVPNADSIIWAFNDGNTISGTLADTTVTHVYNHGMHVPVLIIVKGTTCRSVSTGADTIRVDSVAASFSVVPDHACLFSPVAFTSTSTSLFSTQSSWKWLFSGTDTSTINPTSHTYSSPGTYPVKLVVADAWQCKDSTTKYVTIYPHEASVGPPGEVCPGDSAFISASGGVTYQWYPATGLGCPTCASTNASPAVTTIYTVVVENSHGCNDSLTVTVTIDTLPAVLISTTTSSVCPTASAVLTASGAATYSWGASGTLSPLTGATTTTNPVLTPTTYSVTGTDGHGCSNTDTITIGLFAPAINAYRSAEFICIGAYDTLSADGAVTYVWSPAGSLSSGVGASVIASPITTTTYTVIGTDEHGCPDTASVTVNVDPGPSITTLGHSGTGCTGSDVQLYDSVSGGYPGYTFSWTGPLSFTSALQNPLLPSVTTTMQGWYRLTVTDAHGCIKTDSVYVNIYTPTTFAISGDTAICYGFSDALTAIPGSGMSYTWSPAGSLSSAVGSSVIATPLSTTVYTVSGTNGHECISVVTYTVTVNPLPVITIAATADTVCPGMPTILTASGAVTYSWSPAGTLSSGIGSPVTASPYSTTSYSVTGTDIHGCVSGSSITITTYPQPSITLIGNTGPQCVGSNILLYDTVTGGTPGYTYGWTGPGSYSSASHDPLLTSVTVGMSGWYVLTASDMHGCTRKDSTSVVIHTPTLFGSSGDTSICLGESTILTLTPASGMSYSWFPSGSLSCADCAVTTAQPTATTTYTIVGTNGYGCMDTIHVTVVVHPLPVVSAISGDTVLCVNDTSTLYCSTGGSWTSEYPTIASIEDIDDGAGFLTGVSEGTTLITYTVTSEYGCVTAVTTTVRVDSLPVIDITGHDSVCAGLTTPLSGGISGGSWTALPSSVIIISPTGVVTGVSGGTGIIIYNYSNGLGCSSVDTMNFRVDTIPVVPTLFSKPIVCLHDTTSILGPVSGGYWGSLDTSIATAGETFWGHYLYGVDTGTGILVYTVVSTHGCVGFSTDTCIVLPRPYVAPITCRDSVCLGSTIVMTDSTTGGYWEQEIAINASINDTGLVTGLNEGTQVVYYTVFNNFTEPVPYGCATVVSDTVHVVIPPVVGPITGTDTICGGSTFVFTDDTLGGAWVSLTPDLFSVDGSGTVTALMDGTAVIAYDLNNVCGTARATDTFMIYQPAPPITGGTALCEGFTHILHNATSGGTWSVADTSIAIIDPVTGAVTGVNPGHTTVSYTATNYCGMFTTSTEVTVSGNLFITANVIVACQILPGDTMHAVKGHRISDADGCISVCEHSTIRYYANGAYDANFHWTVVGGTIVADYHDSIDVLWPGAGATGSISLTDSLTDCVFHSSACIEVIQRPTAAFTMSDTAICQNGQIYFTDHSTYTGVSPILVWNWNFGDGTHSSLPNPSHLFGAAGVYTVTLTVRNACFCTDTAQMVVNIFPDEGPEIVCPSVVCEGEIATYSTPNECSSYDWNVTGGHIVSGAGTSTITVAWDAVDADGYGYVSLYEPCMHCVFSSTIRVQVIPLHADISGPFVICAGEAYQYSLPLIGGTQYQWGVYDFPEAVAGYRDDHTVTVRFIDPGSYIIHGWYQNRIKLCGGDVTKKVTVVPSTAILGGRNLCMNDEVTYHFSEGSLSGDWILSDMSGDTVSTATGSADFTYTFSTPGTYFLSSYGDFCSEVATINVTASPAVVDSVHGADTVCLNRPYSYTAYTTASDAVIHWQAIGGTVVPASGRDTVTVIWTDAGTKQLIAHMVNSEAPYCPGQSFTVDITQETVNMAILGDTLPCANAHRTYSSVYDRGELYEWKVFPDTLGSITMGSHSRSMTVLWNNVSIAQTAYLALEVRKCDSVYYDTITVQIQPSPGPVVTASNATTCPMQPVLFTATTGGDHYIWHFGDGTSVTTTTDTITHVFHQNTTTHVQDYVVSVSILPDTTAICPVAGTAIIHEIVLPGPVAYVSAHTNWICPGETIPVYVMITNNISTTTYTWQNHHVTIASATDSTYGITDTGLYRVIITAANGCSDTSWQWRVQPGLCDSAIDDTSCHSHMWLTDYCGDVHIFGDSSVTVYDPRISLIYNDHFYPLATGYHAVAQFHQPGIYIYDYEGAYLPDTCHFLEEVADTIHLVPDYYYRIRCGEGGMDTVFLTDNTHYMPWANITNIVWWLYPYTAPLGTGDNITALLPADSSYSIYEYVYYNVNGVPHSYCGVYHHVVTPPQHPSPAFTVTTSPICEGVAINFNPSDTSYIRYDWDFGDLSSSVLMHTQRTFTYSAVDGAPQNWPVTLSVTDTIGCTSDTSIIVTIFNNDLSGGLGFDQIVCSNGLPISLAIVSGTGFPTHFLWNTGAITPTILVETSGTYWLTISDAYQCQQTIPLPPVHVKVINTPEAIIHGQANYCAGTAIRLSGNAGTGVTYQWMMGDSVLPYTSPVLQMLLQPGYYNVRLVVTVTDSGAVCTDTSQTVTVHVYDSVTAPIVGISRLDCDNYQIQLQAYEPVPGTYNWSDGMFGMFDTIYSGGTYRVWFTDTNGCTASTDTEIPDAPEVTMQYFPTGCHTVCKEQMPITLYGPPHVVFSNWEWIKGGELPVNGYDSEMDPYDLDGSGMYQWHLDNGFCEQWSDKLDISVEPCEKCDGKVLDVIADCNSAPATYTVKLTIDMPYVNAFTVGSNIGPMSPFSGTLPVGPTVVTFTFTTLEVPPPGAMFVYLTTTNPYGDKCFREIKVPLPECEWIEEKGAPTDTPVVNSKFEVATGMMVYPNPASGQVNVGYDYGNGTYAERSIIVYDNLGRTKESVSLSEGHGTTTMDTRNWTPGMYIIRMEGDGKTLHTQRLVVSN